VEPVEAPHASYATTRCSTCEKRACTYCRDERTINEQAAAAGHKGGPGARTSSPELLGIQDRPSRRGWHDLDGPSKAAAGRLVDIPRSRAASVSRP